MYVLYYIWINKLLEIEFYKIFCHVRLTNNIKRNVDYEAHSLV